MKRLSIVRTKLKPITLILFGIITLGLTGFMSSCSCSSKSNNSNDANPYILARTQGHISRKASPNIILSEAVPEDKIDLITSGKAVKISNGAVGTFSYSANTRRITFTPSEDFERNTIYTMTVDLNALLGAENEWAKYSFDFKTLPMNLFGGMQSTEINENDENSFDITFELQSADSEEDKVVEKVIEYSEPCNPIWNHSADGRKHTVKITLKSSNEERTVVLSTKGDKSIGLEAGTIATCTLPKNIGMSVYEVQCTAQSITVFFSKIIDPKQKVRGLATIKGNLNKAVTVDGNKVTLFPDAGETKAEVFLSSAIRSKSGETLGKDTTFFVTLEDLKPKCEILGSGTIVPSNGNATINIRTAYFKAVRVYVYRIYASNAPFFFANNTISGYSDLKFVGRPVAVKTLIFDSGIKYDRWTRSAIDLNEIVKTEPGAIYHIELRTPAMFSAWPSYPQKDLVPSEIAASDANIMAELQNSFDNPTRSYYDDYDSDDYDYNWYWSDREDPAKDYYYYNRTASRNLLATNIGLSAISNSNSIRIFATHLSTSEAISGVKIKCYNAQGQTITSGETDSQGMLTIDSRSSNGRPRLIVASKGDDVSYLRIHPSDQLSTSTFDVNGETIENGLKGFVYGERGVWRPGDNLHIGFIVEDLTKELPENHPATLELFSPEGNLVTKSVSTNGIMGHYTFDVQTDAEAPTGTWRAVVKYGGSSFAMNVKIETIKPNRLKIELPLPSFVNGSERTVAEMHTEWLTGAEAPNLKYEVSGVFVKGNTSIKGWENYNFDNATTSFSNAEETLASGTTNEEGDASIDLTANINDAPGMLKCAITTMVYEPSGEFSTDVVYTTYSPYERYTGLLSPQTSQAPLWTDQKHQFYAASVSADGTPVKNVNLKVNIYRLNWYWWWNARGEDLADFISDPNLDIVNSYNLRTDAQGKARFDINISHADWGTYLIMVSDDEGGHCCSQMAYFDWPDMVGRRSGANAQEAATKLSISTDKTEYNVGEELNISFPAPENSHAIVNIVRGDNIITSMLVSTTAPNTTVSIPSTSEMRPNVYAHVSVIQQHSNTKNNDLPIRMYGVVPIKVQSPESHLHPAISIPLEVESESTCEVKVSETSGRPMSYTLAIVDEGLLNLTHFKTPDPWSRFNMREAFTPCLWDLFDDVCGAYGGRIEQLFSVGGDESLFAGPKATVNRFKPMVQFEGPFLLEKGEKRTHKVNIPTYAGRVRTMVIATDGTAFGSAEYSTIVRKPLMVLPTMPRQIGAGDEATIAATVFVSSKDLGHGVGKKIKVSLTTDNALTIVGDKTQSTTFFADGNKTVSFRVRATKDVNIDRATIQLTASGLDNKEAKSSTTLPIRHVTNSLCATTSFAVEPGMTWENATNKWLSSDFSPKHSTGHIELSTFCNLSLQHRAKYLIGYPHGCLEQTTSKAFAQLYLSSLSQLSKEDIAKAEENVRNGIKRLTNNFVTTSGGLSYWPGQQQANLRYSAYAYIFLSEAESKGFAVPAQLKNRLQDYLRKHASDWGSDQDNNFSAAMALFALAYTGNAQMGEMNRLREHAGNLYRSATLPLAAAFSLAGRKDIGAQLIAMGKKPYNNESIWMRSLQLIATNATGSAQMDVAKLICKDLSDNDWLSTRDISIALFSINYYIRRHPMTNSINVTVATDNGKTSLSSDKTTMIDSLCMNTPKGLTSKTSVKNNGDGTIYGTICVNSQTTQGTISGESNGLTISVRYAALNNKDFNALQGKQGTIFNAYVTVTNNSSQKLENVAVTHILPAGWETLATQGDEKISYQDVRDDRVLTYIDDMSSNSSATYELKLSMTYAGKFYMPSIQAEDMYNAQICGWTDSNECTVE